MAVTDNADVIWGGEDAACALGNLYSLGAISRENNEKVSAGVCELLSEFGIAGTKYYLNMWVRRVVRGGHAHCDMQLLAFAYDLTADCLAALRRMQCRISVTEQTAATTERPLLARARGRALRPVYATRRLMATLFLSHVPG